MIVSKSGIAIHLMREVDGDDDDFPPVGSIYLFDSTLSAMQYTWCN
jgi:hypothetical protein